MEKVTLEIQNLLSFTAAAEILEVSRPTLYKLIKDNKLHPMSIGRNRYILRDEVERLKDERVD